MPSTGFERLTYGLFVGAPNHSNKSASGRVVKRANIFYPIVPTDDVETIASHRPSRNFHGASWRRGKNKKKIPPIRMGESGGGENLV